MRSRQQAVNSSRPEPGKLLAHAHHVVHPGTLPAAQVELRSQQDTQATCRAHPAIIATRAPLRHEVAAT